MPVKIFPDSQEIEMGTKYSFLFLWGQSPKSELRPRLVSAGLPPFTHAAFSIDGDLRSFSRKVVKDYYSHRYDSCTPSHEAIDIFRFPLTYVSFYTIDRQPFIFNDTDKDAHWMEHYSNFWREDFMSEHYDNISLKLPLIVLVFDNLDITAMRRAFVKIKCRRPKGSYSAASCVMHILKVGSGTKYTSINNISYNFEQIYDFAQKQGAYFIDVSRVEGMIFDSVYGVSREVSSLPLEEGSEDGDRRLHQSFLHFMMEKGIFIPPVEYYGDYNNLRGDCRESHDDVYAVHGQYGSPFVMTSEDAALWLKKFKETEYPLMQEERDSRLARERYWKGYKKKW